MNRQLARLMQAMIKYDAVTADGKIRLADGAAK